MLPLSVRSEQEAWASQLRKGVLELAVLGLLAGESRYGSQLVDDLAAHPDLAITAGTVYPLLARLADREKGTTVSFTVFHAGDKTNVIPDKAVAKADIRVLLPEDRSGLVASIRAYRGMLSGNRSGS